MKYIYDSTTKLFIRGVPSLSYDSSQLGQYESATDSTDDFVTTETDTMKLQKRRRVVFKAFDILKSNVSFGVVTLTDDEKTEITTWYNNMLDTNTLSDALDSIPEKVEAYL